MGRSSGVVGVRAAGSASIPDQDRPMASTGRSPLQRLLLRLRVRMAQGMVALVPVLVTVVVLRFLLGFTAGILLPLVDPAVDHWPFVARAGLSLALLLLGLYLLGELTSRVVGRRILTLGETVVLKVPFVRTVYRAAKQVMDAFQGPGARAFKSVVYIEFPRPGMRAVGFVTGWSF